MLYLIKAEGFDAWPPAEAMLTGNNPDPRAQEREELRPLTDDEPPLRKRDGGLSSSRETDHTV